jgi:hypothetical protein
MNLIESIYSQVKQRINQPSKTDGRIWVVTLLLLYFGLLYFADYFIPYQKFWKILGVPTMTPIFADLRGVLASFECTRLGYDVLYELPCDVYAFRRFDVKGNPYPRIWTSLTGLGLDQSHAIALGVLFAISFYLCTLIIIGRLNKYEALIYSLVLCAPPTMFLIERANVDIVIYVLLFIALIITQSQHITIRIAGYATLLIPTFLKLLPLFSLSIILKEKKRDSMLLLVSLTTVCLVYFWNIRDELKAIRSFFSGVEPWYSFGHKILFHELFKVYFPANLFARKAHMISLLVLITFIALSIMIVTKALISLIEYFKRINYFHSSEFASKTTREILCIDSFRLGSSLYLGTYLTTIVYDYKLVFLIFAIPQILLWIKQDEKILGMPSCFALLGIISTFYLSPFFYEWLFDEFVNWFLWVYFLYSFVLVFPDWIKIPIHNFMANSSKN